MSLRQSDTGSSTASEIDWASLREAALANFTLEALPPTLKLPALPHAVTLFMQKSRDESATIAELARIIETDTGLTLELLRHVNSAFTGVRHKIHSVQQAISLLGLRQSTGFIVTTGMQAAVLARRSKLINQSCFWNASLQKALFARETARLLKTDTEVAFAGALLQDYLLPVITTELVDYYVRFVDSRSSQPQLMCDYERQVLGWDHALAGASLAHRWHLPDDLVCCILFHHQGLRILTHPQLGRSPAAAVALSALLPDQLRQHYSGLEQLRLLEGKWGAFSLDELAARVDELHEGLELGVRNDFPLLRRCHSVIDGETRWNDGTLKIPVTTA